MTNKVTRKSIEEAITRIVATGEHPSLERIRRELGGGSYTTIAQVLRTIRTEASAATVAGAGNELPDHVAASAIELAQRIYRPLQASMTDAIQAAQRQADDAIAAVRAELALAESEIRDLERRERQAESAGKRQQAESAALRDRVARAETQAEACAAELASARADLAVAREAERQARTEADQMRGMLSALAPASGATSITRALR